MHFIGQELYFPDVSTASKDGILAIGGDLSVDRLVLAYKKGIFPWFHLEEPIIWWAPDPRFVLFPQRLKISKSMRKFIKDTHLNLTRNQAFHEVVSRCAQTKRKGQASTWITERMIEAYTNLFEKGFAHSVEVWQDDELVGGFYGVDVKNGIFCGESMFSIVDNASKYAFIHFVQNTGYSLIDCQVYTSHLASFGAEMISRKEFTEFLEA